MSALSEAIAANPALAIAAGGFLIGLAFGAIAEATGFCVMGALSDATAFGDTRRLRAWMLAIAVAIIGANTLDAFQIVSLDHSMHRISRLNWAGHLAGGALFGIGMVLAGGCASRNLVRAGAGDIRAALSVIVVGLVAYMSIGGVLGPARANLEDATAVQLPKGVEHLGGLTAWTLGSGPGTHLTVALFAAGALFAACFLSASFRRSPLHILSGLGVGLAVTAGWALTGLAYDEFALVPQKPLSLSFVKPTGDAVEWLERSTALGLPAFGAATVFGTLFGSFAIALGSGRWHLATFAGTGDTVRNLAGAALMGFGGVMALGCTIGQGVTGLSTLAAGSLLSVAGIVAGGLLGLKALERMA